MKLLLIVAVGLLWFISLLHIYWAFGGRWGSAAAVPVKEGEQKPAFTPKKWGTLIRSYSNSTGWCHYCCSRRLFAGGPSKWFI